MEPVFIAMKKRSANDTFELPDLLAERRLCSM